MANVESQNPARDPGVCEICDRFRLLPSALDAAAFLQTVVDQLKTAEGLDFEMLTRRAERATYCLNLTLRQGECTCDRRPWKPNPKVREIAMRDGGMFCHYCGTWLAWLPSDKWDKPQIEHKHPRALGGSDDLSNLVLACQPCNLAKGVKPYDEYMALIGKALDEEF